MATSGTYTWTAQRDDVIKGALRKLGVLPSGGSPTSNQTTDANASLNALIKAFHADGMPLWAIQNYNFTTVNGTSSYTIGTGKTLNTIVPLKIIQALYTMAGGENIPMNVYNRYDFQNLPSMNDSGTPVDLYYQPLADNSGIIQLWPSPSDSTTTITIDYQRPFSDMTNATDNFDFPPYWMQALIYMLAWSLAPEYGTPLMDRGDLQKVALYWKDQALSYGTEEGSLFFQPNKHPY